MFLIIQLLLRSGLTDDKTLQFYFNAILGKGAKSNTYKFALARFLLDHSLKFDAEYIQNKMRRGEDEVISYQEIANAFLKYYWHQECKYRIRQNYDESKPPSVITIIRDVFGREYIPKSFEQMAEIDRQKAQAKIKQKVFGSERAQTSQVIPRFQNIRDGSSSTRHQVFYTYDDDSAQLMLKPHALEFFNRNYSVLIKTVILEWSKFLERINTLPRLIAKIESAEMKRGSLVRYVKIFKDFRNCFYCNTSLDQTEKNVDHFIPWSYLFEDEAWNLVLACKKCNSKKSDSLADTYFCTELIKRNSTYQHQIDVLKKSLVNLDAGKGWEVEIKHHYRNCGEYGFGRTRLP
jgi:hypothetical protein